MQQRETTALVAAIESSTWRRTISGGVAVIATFALSLAVYHAGQHGTPSGMTIVILTVLGCLLGILTRTGITRTRITLVSLISDASVTGILTAAAGPITVIKAPTTWHEVFMLAPLTAASLVLLYHGVNTGRALSCHRSFSIESSFSLVFMPFMLGWLLILNAPPLLAQLGGPLWGRILVLSVFLAVLAGQLTVLMKRRLPSLQLILVALFCAIMAVLAAWVADFGAGPTFLSWPAAARGIGIITAVMVAQAGLWGMVYLMTGMILDAIRGIAPTWRLGLAHARKGIQRGAIYGAVFISILLALAAVTGNELIHSMFVAHPLMAATGFGACLFPFLKTLIETFDGSTAFFPRLRAAWTDSTLWLRGLIAGFGFSWAIIHQFPAEDTGMRALLGFGFGAITYSGVTLFRDTLLAWTGRGRPSTWRIILMETLLGGLIGSAIGFYLDANQIGLVLKRFAAYQAIAQTPSPVMVYPLLNKWGLITLGHVTGGANLFFYESVTGVIVWAIPAWLFALNATFMRAAFQHETGPIRQLFSRDGFRQLGENMIYVLRWGLWMAPIINTFLRPMADPTWYNQDGAIRTVVATVQQVRLTPDDFHVWSLSLFTSLLAHDWVRILIWIDHMGLRVATLVNLSFIGVDRMESRLARWIAPWSTGRCVPEAVKRFATWAPLLIPYYIPMGGDWDVAWKGFEAHQAMAGTSLIERLFGQPWPIQLAIAGASTIPVILLLALFSRKRKAGAAPCRKTDFMLSNPAYELVMTQDGALSSRSIEKGRSLTRPSCDPLEPAGRLLFLVDSAGTPDTPGRAWPVLGNFPASRAPRPALEQTSNSLTLRQEYSGIRTTLDMTLPDPVGKTELWSITLENTGDKERFLNVIPYLEWVLNTSDADRGHTQYTRMFAQLEYSAERQTLTAWDAHSKLAGFMASATPPAGFLTARIDFLGRARSVWNSRVLETLQFAPPQDTALHPTFDPIGSLCIPVGLAAGATRTVKLVVGMAPSRAEAADCVSRYLGLPDTDVFPAPDASHNHPIRHGEIPPGTPQPYCSTMNEGRTLRIHTPFTPRPYDHTLANHLGQATIVTNRGLQTSSNGNSQQNRLTADWADMVTREVPSEAFYIHDPVTHEWFSPTYHPLHDSTASYETDFSVDGTAVFRMKKGDLESELTVFVPHEASLTVYLLTLRNHRKQPRPVRVAPFFQISLADQPEHAGPLQIRRDISTGALLYDNRRNIFRKGPAFAAFSVASAIPEVHRSHFIGKGNDITRPIMVEQGSPEQEIADDGHPIAAFLATLDLPAQGESTVCFVLGQADDPMSAAALVRNHAHVYLARKALTSTQAWWLNLAGACTVQTTRTDFDRFLPWLNYQTLAERLWARRGFYQTSGAYGFRDQLQDSINLVWTDPSIARRQILLHAAQQFTEGDVAHWFHVLPRGRTGMAARTHASDNLLWLVWSVGEYIRMTGDTTILEEKTPYLEAEQPFAPLPAGKEGMGFVPIRSARVDTVYHHCMLALDRVLKDRMGKHGLPLMGTGDWNDGLDSIGSEGRGESVWLGFFLDVILSGFIGIIEHQEGTARGEDYRQRQTKLRRALEQCWREDRYLRAIHDDGTEIGVQGSGVWEIDALTAAWAVFSGINPARARQGFDTALSILERSKTILLGWPALRADTKPYLGRSSHYPEGVRENGMYCHGVQWLVGAARVLAEQAMNRGEPEVAQEYRDTAWRLWDKIAPLSHTTPSEIEIYGGQPNKQAADLLTAYDPGRMIWHGYTGAAGWMLRQALEGVLGVKLAGGQIQMPPDWTRPRGPLLPVTVRRTPPASS